MSANTEISITIPPWGFPIISFLCLLVYLELGGWIGSMALWLSNCFAVVFALAFLFGRFMYKKNDQLIQNIVNKGDYKTKSRKSGYYLAFYAFVYAVVATMMDMHGTQVIWAGLSLSILWCIFTLQDRVKTFELLKELEPKA